MQILDKYLSRSDFHFSLLVSMFNAWFYALSQTTFSFYILMRIIFSYLACVLFFGVILWLLTKWLKHPLFGARTLWYYPTGPAVTVAVIISTLVALLYAFMGPASWTTQYIVTLIIGWLISIAAIMLYLKTLVKPKES